MNTFHKICLVFTIIGAFNWGLVALLDTNLVTVLFGVDTVLTKLVYSIIAISALINSALLFREWTEVDERKKA